MSARSIWTGTLTAGLVSMGVKIYKATDDAKSETAMRMLHSTCKTPINEKKVCSKCNVDVPASDVVKGVEVAKDTFVIMTKEDIDSIKPKTAETIAVESFIDANIDPLYIASSYFIAPDKGAAATYALLHAAMVEKGKAMQARLAIYGREHIVTIITKGSGFVLQLMRTKDEVRDMSELPTYIAPKSVPVDKAQLALANQLVDMMSGTFDPTDYEDEYTKEFKALVTSKQSGTPLPEKGAAPTAMPGELLAALRASLATKAVKPAKTAKVAPVKKSKAK